MTSTYCEHAKVVSKEWKEEEKEIGTQFNMSGHEPLSFVVTIKEVTIKVCYT